MAVACVALPRVAGAEGACPTAGRAAALSERPASLVHCRDAAAAIDRVWAAHALAQLGKATEASELFAGLEKSLPELAPELARAAAEACRDGGGAPATCLALLPDEAATEPWREAGLEALRARLSLAAGEPKAAEEAARRAEAAGADAGAMAGVELQAALALHRSDEAAKTLHRLRLDFPGTPAAREAERSPGISALDDAIARYSAAELARRWARWTAAGGAEGVAQECPALATKLHGGAREVARARLACGSALATVHDDSAEELLDLAAKEPGTAPAALLALARVRARATRADPVEAVCHRLGSLGHRASDEWAECDFLAASMRQHHGPPEAARRALEAMVRRHPGHPRATDAAWLLALDDLRADPAKARPRLDALVKSAKTAEEKARALYFRARTWPKSDAAHAQADERAAERLDPLGYYGWLAAARLGDTAKARTEALPANAAVAPAGAALPEAMKLARLLLDAGFPEAAGEALRRELHPAGAKALAYAPYLADAGQFELLVRIGLAHGAAGASWPPSKTEREVLEAAYPLAFPEALAGAPKDVDPFLLLALMRRESRFDPDATSGARARGLLQLLPDTAANLAKELGDAPPATPEALFDPALNVRLAGRYVQDLLARFHDPLLAAAAYNAGPKAVADWTKANEGLAVDEWVERIPYRETRAYVKAVGAAFAAYGLVWRGARPPLSFAPVRPAGAGVAY